MFLTESQLLQSRLEKNLEFADKIDIATAWATPGSALDALGDAVGKSEARLRAIVGISGNATDPDALERLNQIGQLRLAAGDGRIFHPKVYIFRGPKKSVAWIGSANFTGGGFESNEEAVFETEDVDSIVDWFDARWTKCGELKPTDIGDYRKRRRDHPPSKEMRRLVSPPQSAPPGNWIRLDKVERYRVKSSSGGYRLGPYKVNPHPIKIRFKAQDIDCEWTECGGPAWQKMFVCIADWLAREGKLTKGACPVEIKEKGSSPFRCVDTDRGRLPRENEKQRINGGMWAAEPLKANWSARRTKQLLEKFDIAPRDVKLRMSE